MLNISGQVAVLKKKKTLLGLLINHIAIPAPADYNKVPQATTGGTPCSISHAWRGI